MVCSKMKPIEEYYVRDKKTLRRHSECKECTKARLKRSNLKNPMLKREYSLKRMYGINQDDYNQMLTEQNDCCAICGTTEPGAKQTYFMVDHCHDTGEVRGLLCKSCNIALGEFKDDPSLLEKAVLYLRS